MSMEKFGYEYFCGANVSVSFNGASNNSDVAGISYEALDSSTPIYGYSSRLFDAVAPGQKLIRGSFVLNYKNFKSFTNQVLETKLSFKTLKKVGTKSGYGGSNLNIQGKDAMMAEYEYHSEYISENFEEKSGVNEGKINSNNLRAYNEYIARVAYSDTYSANDGLALAEMLHEDQGFETDFLNTTKKYLVSAMDATMVGPFNIKIKFHGGDSFTIVSCYVNNFGSSIQISEDVILQEFSFFGRNIIH